MHCQAASAEVRQMKKIPGFGAYVYLRISALFGGQNFIFSKLTVSLKSWDRL